MSHTKVKSFSDIIIHKNSLVVLDIDETVMKFQHICEKWWQNRFDHYYDITKDYDASDKLSYNEWTNHITITTPEHMDEKGFVNLLNNCSKMNCEMIYVSARPPDLLAITLQQMSVLNIVDPVVHLIGDKNKGIFINNLINGHDNLIFVDDRLQNIIDVMNNVNMVNKYMYMLVKD